MTCSCSGLTEIREALPRKSINIQTRFWGSISSTVAMNSANGPFKSLTASPLVHCLGGNSLPAASQRSIKSDTNPHGTDLGRLSKLTNLDTPIVLFIFFQGPVWGSNATNIYPEKSGRRSLVNRVTPTRVTSCSGRKVSKPWRRKLRSASRWAFGLNCKINQGWEVLENFFPAVNKTIKIAYNLWKLKDSFISTHHALKAYLQ